jgi:peptidyl-prolyl cis-trans isomerase SurA
MVTPYADQQVTNVKRDDAKSPAEAQAKVARLLRDIQGGLDFGITAREWSEDYNSAPNGGDLSFQSLKQLDEMDPKIKQTVQRLKVGESSPLVETRFGYHILKLLEKDLGGQKDLNSPSVSAQIRQAIFNQKEQMLRAAFSEVARNKAQVNNYLAERLLESGGKSTAPGAENKAETKADTKDAKPEEKPEEKKEEPKAPEKPAEPKKD